MRGLLKAEMFQYKEAIKDYEERKAACQVILRYIMMPSDINKFFDGIKYGNA
jgi:hypothetical protein